MRPNVEDLQAIWLFTYARSSLLDAANFLGELSEIVPELSKITPESLRYRALVDAAVVAYSRPFTTCFLPPNRKKVVPLKDALPPQHLAQFHEDALAMRDTAIGHKDATPAKGYTATPNIVLVGILPDNFSLNATTFGQMLPSMKNALGKLCDYFVNQCEANLSRLRKIYLSEFMKHRPGLYELVISEPPSDWLIPFRGPKHGEDYRISKPPS
jgi:hypothetical protein